MPAVTVEIDEYTERCLACIVELEGGLRTEAGEIDYSATLLHVLRGSNDGHSFVRDCPECAETVELSSLR